MTNRSKPLRWLAEAGLGAVSLMTLLPLLYMVMSSFKTMKENTKPLSLPGSLNWDNYATVFRDSNVLSLFGNSLLVTTVSMLLIIFVGSMAGYVLGRSRKKWANGVYLFFLSGMMIPFIGTIVPLYQLVKSLHLIDNLLLLILVPIGGAMPMVILIYTGFVKSVPRELEESAYIDGSGYLRTYFQIVFPLLMPATSAVVITNIIALWNDFMTPLMFISSEGKMTIALGIYAFMSEKMKDWGAVYALTTLTVVPLILVFLLGQRQFYKGITSGAVKG